MVAVRSRCTLSSVCLSLHEVSLSPAAHQPGRWDPPQLPLLPQSFQWEAGDPRLAGEDFPQGHVEAEAPSPVRTTGLLPLPAQSRAPVPVL